MLALAPGTKARPEINTNETARIYERFDVSAKRLVRAARAEGHVIPCGPGCDACCSSAANALPFEIPLVIEAVRAMPVERREEIRRGLAKWARTLREAGVDIRSAEPSPIYERARAACPFLLDHRCSIYDARPISCRGHYLIDQDPKRCANRGQHIMVQCLTVDAIAQPALAELIEAAYPGKDISEWVVGLGLFQALVLSAWRLVDEAEPDYDAWAAHVLAGGV